jgi:hypothetical protein
MGWSYEVQSRNLQPQFLAAAIDYHITDQKEIQPCRDGSLTRQIPSPLDQPDKIITHHENGILLIYRIPASITVEDFEKSIQWSHQYTLSKVIKDEEKINGEEAHYFINHLSQAHQKPNRLDISYHRNL